MTQLKNLPVPIPPLSEQMKFRVTVNQYNRLREQQREGARQAEHLFQTLLHRAFRGQLTGVVSEAEEGVQDESPVDTAPSSNIHSWTMPFG